MIETAWPYLAVTARRWGREIAWHVREWAVILAFCGVSAVVGLFTWALTTPAPKLPCGAGRVTLTCPFPSPEQNRPYLGDQVVLQDGRLVIRPKLTPRTEGRR